MISLTRDQNFRFQMEIDPLAAALTNRRVDLTRKT